MGKKCYKVNQKYGISLILCNTCWNFFTAHFPNFFDFSSSLYSPSLCAFIYFISTRVTNDFKQYHLYYIFFYFFIFILFYIVRTNDSKSYFTFSYSFMPFSFLFYRHVINYHFECWKFHSFFYINTQSHFMWASSHILIEVLYYFLCCTKGVVR